MKKTAYIITLKDDNNFGNRLQNYAVQELLKKYDLKVKTLRIYENNKDFITKMIKGIIRPIVRKRCFDFYKFNRFLKISYCVKKPGKKADYYFSGSDQVWNPYFEDLRFCTLPFAEPEKRYSISASIGMNNIPDEKLFMYEPIKSFNKISVREERAKEIIEEITGRNDIEVLLDPTMLLTADKWERIIRRPPQLKNNKKYVMVYFLGGHSDTYKSLIENFATENNCEIIDVLDKSSYYNSDPGEFLYLIKNAYAVFGDSFHMCVFSIVFQKDFAVFERNDMGEIMNSRVETLFSKLNISKSFFKGERITKEILNYDYSETFKTIDAEREKAFKFIEECLNL